MAKSGHERPRAATSGPPRLARAVGPSASVDRRRTVPVRAA
ncbi:hypothetical protein BURPS1710A_A2500 [Burkholderia pseudomallei 1710a]|uniref:Uncharacterized protein n=1 Tax=Burkholderia pseudomallei 1710a TaxID=320371 RepID=A0A0E1VRU7_BURPE|nr:hypothetical protein BURPS1710A_A2500 [Burkholderia pseudomallei 1710a]